MCAIIGLSATKQGFNGSLLKLLNESKIRGLHAFGMSWFDPEIGLCCKKYLNLIDLKHTVSNLKADKVLIHCRYSTSGDYKVIENNQPIVSQQNCLIFNGIISMASKQQNEAIYNEKYLTDNDGEIILKMIEKKQDFIKFLSKNGSFAGGVLNCNGSLTMFRNHYRPMHVVTDQFGTWYSSTKDIFERAGFKGSKECEPLRTYNHD